MKRSSPHRSEAAKESVNSPLIKTLRQSIESLLGLELREVQLQAAGQLLARSLVEMQTGEGKTLTIALAASLLGSRGRRVMIATANAYLAERDADWMRGIFSSVGLSVSFVDPNAGEDDRRIAYRSNIVYGTISQFAFDFLRQRAARRQTPGFPALIGNLNTLIIDEADSILIDEARTPLLIHACQDRPDLPTAACIRWAAEAAKTYTLAEDFVRTAPHGAVALTARGRAKLLRTAMSETMNSLTMTDIQHALERAILVNQTIHRDHHYLVHDGRVAIVDEYTGRLSTNRSFGDGIQQAIEAREQIELTPISHPIARITVQEFVTQFAHVCGTTATASDDQDELRRVYGFRVAKVPTHLPCKRVLLDPVVCKSQADKHRQIVQEVQQLLQQRRAVLIGTRTIDQSEAISQAFGDAGIEHVVLNAREHRQEAEIVAAAGMPGRVTVATNMAGRGTDIALDRSVREAGGLHVIVAEMNMAARIDSQLIGRGGRQGDPGTARIYISAEDDLFKQAGLFKQASLAAGRAKGTRLLKLACQAQKRIQRDQQRQRYRLTAQQSNLAASLRSLGLDPYLDQPTAW